MKAGRGVSLVNYSSSSEDEQEKQHSLGQGEEEGIGSDAEERSESSENENEDRLDESEDEEWRNSNSDDGINSLSNILSLHEKLVKAIKGPSVEYPVNFNLKFREFDGGNERARPITAISLPGKGQKMICGTIDGEIEIYNFESLYENDMNPSKIICPLENHAIQNVEFDEKGTFFISACGDSICRVFAGNGEMITGTVQGDPYVKSARSNLGHTHMILDCKWDPVNENRFLTCSIDGTLRLFDLNSDPVGIDRYIPSNCVMRCINKRNMSISSSVQVESMCVSSLGENVAAGCSDGSVQVFSRTGNIYSGTPSIVVRDAHSTQIGGKGISNVGFVELNSTQDKYLISRGVSDESIKIWDMRKTNKPLKQIGNLPCVKNGRSRLVFSGCKRSVLTSTTRIIERGGERSIISNPNSADNFTTKSERDSDLFESRLISLNIEPLILSGQDPSSIAEAELRKDLVFLRDDVISTFDWSHEINQIFLALGGGGISVYYDDELPVNPSNCGVISAIGRKRKQHFQGFSDATLETYNIEELPEGFKETKSGEIKYVGSGSKKKHKMYAPRHPDFN
ncbi:WD domain, G-beta repeat-containing protein [Cryptosporidium felis]|nr:WD domain, G-beta repeat-containing protein [Cryptosporidium felis]